VCKASPRRSASADHAIADERAGVRSAGDGVWVGHEEQGGPSRAC
jgi:hypothetical protein